MTEKKKDILWRIYLVYISILLFAVAIIYKVASIQFSEGEYWKEKSNTLTISQRDIEAVRGNIYAEDGSLLATSVPIYEIRMDVNSDAITDEIFNENISSLAEHLSDLFKDKTPIQYKSELIRARTKGERYHLIKRNVKYTELKKLKTFPLFNKGKYKGGFIYVQQNRRVKPFNLLAERTIGYDRPGIQAVGLEGAYLKHLRGQNGKKLMQRITGNMWMPLNDENEIEPHDGSDIITTIDINIQDVAEHALLTQLQLHEADHGCVVLMEVQTGNIKAIANLKRLPNGEYYEGYNYAIGESTEPGSTFKLASLICALDDGYIDLEDIVDTENGKTKYYDRIMQDSHEGGYGKISIQKSFEVSSNVAISKIITQAYAKNPKKFTDKLSFMGLSKKLNLEISGEGVSRIKTPEDKDWYGTTLPWMSIGYELKLTPLQILTFYNAVANNGKMVKPKFVKRIMNKGKLVEEIKTEIINPKICAETTIQKAKQMLEGVVENGTAKNLKNDIYKIAGKTGTAQIANDKYGYKYQSKVSYQASLVGYFPADKPKYSCIVVVNAPSRNVYYGNLVAGPIFKEVADKIYARSIEIHKELDKNVYASTQKIPVSKDGYADDLKQVYAELNISTPPINHQWVYTNAKEKMVDVKAKKITPSLVPDVCGMGLKDALFLLENIGLRVTFNGTGVIKNQSVPAGSRFNKNDSILLELS
ncbi:MAG: transpeptidase family protein [Bacteroidetes bacterium]|nr:PASTA domain-containing protein [Bacteroidota bacterium]MBV6460317.1 putative peptidoglycan D,D-transpeptidase PenA [Flavobacteriales bacterium]WKZ74684.1 MAG: penicillin-binding protein [Vicingaceae bacterium]MCL4815817.1 transpeptidase family protein [Flavobacteriales bacterium]NOG94992.1 transpeptidase family protein [Bacteroidota bacterium]